MVFDDLDARDNETEEQYNTAVETINADAKQAKEIKAKIEENRKYLEAKAKVDAKVAEYDGLTKQIAAIDSEKERLICDAEFPIKGLSFGTDAGGSACVMYGGLPLQAASQGEQIRVSTAIMVRQHQKQHPETAPLLLIRDGSLLDSDNLRMIVEIVRQADGLVLLERTTEDAEIKVVISEAAPASPEKERQAVPMNVLRQTAAEEEPDLPFEEDPSAE